MAWTMGASRREDSAWYLFAKACSMTSPTLAPLGAGLAFHVFFGAMKPSSSPFAVTQPKKGISSMTALMPFFSLSLSGHWLDWWPSLPHIQHFLLPTGTAG